MLLGYAGCRSGALTELAVLAETTHRSHYAPGRSVWPRQVLRVNCTRVRHTDPHAHKNSGCVCGNIVCYQHFTIKSIVQITLTMVKVALTLCKCLQQSGH